MSKRVYVKWNKPGTAKQMYNMGKLREVISQKKKEYNSDHEALESMQVEKVEECWKIGIIYN